MQDKSSESKKVTIKSIAEALNISFSTVSKALNNNPVIKSDTRQLVIDKAQEMGYTPNSLAKGLRGSSTKTIAIIFNDIENPVLTYVFRDISIRMGEHGYTTMIFDSQFNEQTERANILTVLSRVPDFIILEPATFNSPNLDLLQNMADRVIIQGARSPHLNSHHVHVDYTNGGYMAAVELLSKGHKECLVISESLDFPTSHEFVRGVEKAFADYNLTLRPEQIVSSHSSIANGFRIMQQLWDSEAQRWAFPLTGVLTFDDNFAFGVYKAAAHFNLKIPDDLSVIGFDDNPLSAFSMPPLTTVHLPKEKMAEYHLSIINTILLKKRREICIYSTDPVLIPRGSVKNLIGSRHP
ncbi:LacI family DNA-binding transcriptional regulator [uncultured Pluralibacter sp.]|uniref:LacI family DNA-binding transcriptional regulator n=1 Tax=uncultured Pluralibacter sp. TaxID=1490864 RepID=UPI0026186D57|nr:LacI family DNA-binding transcriptional regulator [uncultured Pluralibacter sp.]